MDDRNSQMRVWDDRKRFEIDECLHGMSKQMIKKRANECSEWIDERLKKVNDWSKWMNECSN